MITLNPMTPVKAKRLVKSNVTQVINSETLIVNDDGILFLYNERLDQYEGFDSLEDIFNSAVHHRTFQQCI